VLFANTPIVQKLSLWYFKLIFASSFFLPSVNPNGSRGKLPIYPSLQDYIVLISKTTLFWASKQRRFGHFIIIFLKKKKKRKKKKENIKKKKGGKEIGGGSSHPHGRFGVVPPWPRGWSGHPQKPQKKKKKNEKWVLAFWGWPDHPQGPGGGFGHPNFVLFFWGGFWGWPDHPLGHGGGSTTPRPAVGVAPATPDFFPPPFFFFNIFLFLFSFFF
jgi:hypothetical protein